jgi:hypothetical protein
LINACQRSAAAWSASVSPAGSQADMLKAVPITASDRLARMAR